ncbi:MAG: GAF domain-containing protein, partial [Omnitrophica WOR_2 bacterium]
KKLQANFRLPFASPGELSTNNPGLENGLKSYSTSDPFFAAPVNGNSKASNAVAATMLDLKPWTIAYFQPQSIFLAPIQELTRNTLLLAALIAAITFFTAFLITQRLTKPIIDLTRVAETVAGGDLRVFAHESPDEIGILASAFNLMTAELKRTLENMERRVMERTSDLAQASEQMKYRINQLQTIAEVARTIASLQDVDQLLEQVTHLIYERFGFYHVGIFLLDDKKEYAVLQASNSEGGKRMLARGHKLKVGEVGIVGNVTGTGEPRIALDVGSDAIYFDNPDLPDTRSEIALPLQLGDKIIGALDVQSLQPSAFKEEDISLLGVLADQIAIAIENSRLYNETHSTLVELQKLHSQYLAREWSQSLADRGKGGYLYNYGKFSVIQPSETGGIWESLQENHPVVIPSNSDGSNGHEGVSRGGLIAPITVRGQIIGALNFEETTSPHQWEEYEIQMIQEVADQIGLALENARLLEQTQRRAEREHLVADITTKMRASNDPEVILQTAAVELRKALRARRAQVVIKTPDGQEANHSKGKNGNNPDSQVEQPDTKGIV